MSDDRITKLEAENAELKARISALEQPKTKPEFKVQPYQPIDWTANMSLPRSAIEAMVRAVPDSVVRGVVGDNYGKGAPVEKPVETKVIPSQKGWVEPAPLGPPEGQRWVDAQLDVAAALDKAELAKKLGQKP